MTTAIDTENKVTFIHNKDRGFTEKEYDALADEMWAAYRRGDMETYDRIDDILPVDPEVAMIFKKVYGKERLLAMGLDLTEASIRYGEGWLDEPKNG